MSAHIKSIVPQRGGVSPIDNNTVFYAPFDEHANDMLRGLKVSGNQSALLFDGATTKINVADSDILDVEDAITIECWVKPKTLTKTLAAVRKEYSYILQVNASGSLRPHIYIDGAYQMIGSLTGVVVTGVWQHLAMTYDGANLKGYVNGIEVCTRPVTGKISKSTSQMTIGYHATTEFLDGPISELKIWNRALSSDELLSRILPMPNGLMSYWKFNENEGSIAYDYSGNGNDVVISNGSWAEGSAVYSLVKDGYPGGVIQAQEATENILPNVDLTDTTKWTHRTSTVTKTTEIISPNKSDIFKAVPTAGDAAITWTTSMSSFPAGTYTMSVWMRAPDGQQHTVGWSTGHVTSTANPLIVTDQWQRFTLTQTSTSTPTTYLHLVGGYSTWSTGETLYLTEPQVEAKSYATEFTANKRSGRKSYGGGVLVEEGTANHYTSIGVIDANATLTVASWAEAYNSNPVVKITKSIGTPSTHASYRQCIASPSPVPYSSVCTLSFKAKILSGDISSIGKHFGGGTSTISYKKKLDNDWYMFEYTGISPSGGGLCVGVGFVGDAAVECLITEMQLEIKPYVTSFVAGTRSDLNLKYPVYQYQTISGWFKLINRKSDNGWQRLVGSYTDATKDHWYFNIAAGTTGDSVFRVRNKVTNTEQSITIIPSEKNIADNDWHFFSLVFDVANNKLRYHLDDFMKEVTWNDVVDIFPYELQIGKHLEAEHANGIYDEIRIDKVARTEAEILAWYYQGRNGW